MMTIVSFFGFHAVAGADDGLSKPFTPLFEIGKLNGIPSDTESSRVKNEFDLLRQKGEKHELMAKYHIDALPFVHPDIDKWRNNFVGKQYLHPQTNLLIFTIQQYQR